MWLLAGSERPALFVDIPKTASKSTYRLYGGEQVARHASIRHVLDGGLGLDPREHFTFSIVRNPWERMFSLWYWNRFVKARKQRCPGVSFEEFCLTFELARWAIPGLDPAGVSVNRTPQTAWVTDAAGAVAVDKVYRFERLEKCWRDLDARGYRRTAPGMHVNRLTRKPKDWRSRYSQEMVDAVARIFAPDIETFGYAFR